MFWPACEKLAKRSEVLRELYGRLDEDLRVLPPRTSLIVSDLALRYDEEEHEVESALDALTANGILQRVEAGKCLACATVRPGPPGRHVCATCAQSRTFNETSIYRLSDEAVVERGRMEKEMAGPAKKAFISYAHGSDAHRDSVLVLARRLVEDGVDVEMDQFSPTPPEGWPRWMVKGIFKLDFVIAVCSPVYAQRVNEDEPDPAKGKGAIWEGHHILQRYYDDKASSNWLVPVLLGDEPESSIPKALGSLTHYRFPSQYEGLYRHLTGQPAVVKPPLGTVKKLPSK